MGKDRSIFNRAIDLPPSQRAEYLSTACKDDSGLRREVEGRSAGEENVSGVMGQSDNQPAEGPEDKDPGSIKRFLTYLRSRGAYFWIVIATTIASYGTAALIQFSLVGSGETIWHCWQAQPSGGVFVVTAIDPMCADQLKIGDQIVALDGDTRVAKAGPLLKLAHLRRSAGSYQLTVLRSGRQLTTTIKVDRYPFNRANATQYLIYGLIVLITVGFASARRPGY